MYVVFAVIATGGVSVTSCQPDTDSLVNVASASSTPVADQRWPTCAPVFAAPLKKRTAVTNPLMSDRNFTPTSIGCPSVTVGFAGVAAGGQMLHGQPLDCAATRSGRVAARIRESA